MRKFDFKRKEFDARLGMKIPSAKFGSVPEIRVWANTPRRNVNNRSGRGGGLGFRLSGTSNSRIAGLPDPSSLSLSRAEANIPGGEFSREIVCLDLFPSIDTGAFSHPDGGYAGKRRAATSPLNN